LDPRAEKIVQQALDNVSANRTTITIAHKLSTIQKANNICVMSQGSLIEQGTHNELLARDGAYAKLVFSQDLERTADKPAGDSEETSDDEANGEDDQHFRKLALKRTVSSSGSAHMESDQPGSPGTMGYGLLKCLGLLIKEQPKLWYLYALTALISIFGGGTLAVQAVLFSRTFNVFQMTGNEAISEGNFWALMFFVVAIANFFLYFALGFICNMISQKVTRRYRQELFENTVKQPSAFFDKEANATGALTSRLARCATDLQELLSANAGLVINNVVTTISCAILGIAYGWKLGLVCTFGAMPPLLLGGYYGIRISTKLDDDTTKRFAGSAAIAAEAVAAIRTVASLVLERTILDEYERRLNVVASRSIKSLSITMIFFSLTQSINFCAMALGFWYGGKLVSTGEYTTEQFFVVFIAIVLGGESVASFFQYSTSISKATPAANYIFFLRTQTPKSDDGDDSEFGAEKIQGQPASVEIDSLEFAYPSRPRAQVIKNINVHVPAGRFVAFVGASGCGKSTMISLLARFYDPTSGSISINNQPIVDIGRREHRRRIALVQQEPVLYSGSIRENVSMGVIESMEPTETQVEDALRSANILDFVKSLSEGLNTPLGNRGTQLSGGQRQRVAIARALIRNPRILLLDEATSALDTESEKIVQAALMEAAKDGGRTTVAVAHRLSTIKDADTICVFQAGKIIEVGNHESLVAERGTYFEMCKGQALDKAAT
jgi:ATP-binding cassette subfamily B (MDR/TAP) protein 1